MPWMKVASALEGLRVIIILLKKLSSKLQQGPSLGLALLPGAISTVKHAVSGKFIANLKA